MAAERAGMFEYELSVSLLEIYNENIRDLVEPDDEKGQVRCVCVLVCACVYVCVFELSVSILEICNENIRDLVEPDDEKGQN